MFTGACGPPEKLSLALVQHSIVLRMIVKLSYPVPSNFLRRMLDENEGLWKGPVLKVRK